MTSVITWYKHTIDGCFWKYVGDKISLNGTILETNNVVCRIPKRADFIEKYKWLDLPSDEKSNYFTIGREDIIVNGEVDDDIDEYLATHRSTDLIAKYKDLQGCMVVDKFAINTEGGRCQEHYYVKGT